MDNKSISFLVVGLLLGVFLTSLVFSLSSRRASGAVCDDQREQPRVVLKLAHVLDQGHPVHEAMVFMAERLAEKSHGEVTLKIFPNGQLGSETESIEQVQRGVLAMVKTSAAPLEGFVPEMAVFGLPYLFRDSDHYWKVLLGEIGRELLDSGQRVGLKGLCYYDSGSRSFYTTDRPILTPADLAGKKIRVIRSKTAMDMISQLGGSPTPIPWGELYTALQQGMVDGAENNPPTLLSSRHFEVTKHYSLDEHTRIPDMVLFSEQIWRSLDPHVKTWIQEAAAESVTFQRRLWQKKTEEALKELERSGVTIYRPDQRVFLERVRGMYAPLQGTRLGELVRRIREVK
jgi:tripartite ATP-independent transporter DctP family solute receptor